MINNPVTPKTRRVLVVEDDKGWQTIFKTKLESRGYFVGLAGTLDEAQKELDSCIYQISIVDLKLDENDPENKEGVKVIKHIWSLFEGTRAIVHSGFIDENIIINIINDLAEEGIPQNSLNFLAKGSKTNADETLKKVQELIVEAENEYQRLSARMIWKVSPFSFINGMLAREVQMAMGGGRMSELREFLAELCAPCAPWLQARDSKVLTPVFVEDDEKNQLTVGFQTNYWSRALGHAVAIRFGRQDFFEQALKSHPLESFAGAGKIGKELWTAKNQRFEGRIYKLENIDFRENFRSPAPKRTLGH